MADNSPQLHRVVARDSAGNWVQIHEAPVLQCRHFVRRMPKRKRKEITPIVTRRTLAEWLEKVDET